MGIDIGTSGCKALITDSRLTPRGQVFVAYPTIHPKIGWAEQDPLDWWRATVRAIRQLAEKVHLNRGQLRAISVDSHNEAVVPIDNKGTKLFNGILWTDQRTTTIFNKIKRAILAEDVLRITGLQLQYPLAALNILWIKENHPSVYAKTDVFLPPKDYIVNRLTGSKMTDPSIASRSMLMDIHSRQWSETICDSLDIPLGKLPQIRRTVDLAGELTEASSRATGLSAHTQVAVGGGDDLCQALGAGVVKPGQLVIGGGTGSTWIAPVSKPKIEHAMGVIDCVSHVIADTWALEIMLFSTGGSMSWFKDKFAAEGTRASIRSYSYLDELARDAEELAGLFYYPYLWGTRVPRPEASARAAFFGIGPDCGRPQFVRAILEGVAFNSKSALDIFHQSGMKFDDVRMAGGETKSQLWNQIKADVMGIKFKTLKTKDTAALGSSVIASLATRFYDNPIAVARLAAKIERTYIPRKKKHNAYMKTYRKYLKVGEIILNGHRVISRM